MQEVDVNYSVLVNVSFSQETSHVLKKRRLAQSWHSKNLDDVVLSQQSEHVEHVLVAADKRSDLVWQKFKVSFNSELLALSSPRLKAGVNLLRTVLAMAFIVFKQHYLLALKFPEGLFNFFLRILISIANVLVGIKDFVVEILGKLNGSAV